MTNATKTLLIIFISSVLLTALVKWTSGPASSEAFRSVIVDVDREQIDKVQIERPAEGKTVVLEETPSGWMVSGTDRETAVEADSGLIQRALDRLANLKVRAVVTRNPEKHTRYKADSTGTIVSLYGGDKLLESVVIGAPQFVSQREFNNYVRPLNEEAVYSVEGFLESSFNREFDRWRNRQVWDIQRGQIARIGLLLPADSSYSLKRTDGQDWIAEGDTVRASKVSSMLNRLRSLSANGFADDSLSVSTFGAEHYAVQLQLKDGTQRTIRLRPDEHDDTSFLAVATGFPYVFTVSQSTWKSSVLKPREELLE